MRDLGEGDDTASIVKAIISLGHSLGMKVIAEGVETEEQMSFLMENHCDAMQGFLFSRPLTAHDFTLLLERESSATSTFSILQQLCSSFRSREISAAGDRLSATRRAYVARFCPRPAPLLDERYRASIRRPLI